jgi:chemotaxis family two-component system response regulator Rcp1
MLAEDNPADAGLVRKALEDHGVEGEITIFTDGEAAIQFVQSVDAQEFACPDLVIIDLNLPKKPGREVLECLRLSVTCDQVPVVILSSSDAAQDRADVARLGASRYIRKPSRLEEFLSLGAIFRETLAERSV